MYISQLPGILDIAWQARGSDIIFILCGLLVSLSLFREQQKFGQFNFRKYFIQRLFRIYPLFLLALAIYLAIDSHRYIYLLSNLLFVTNLFAEQKNIIPIGWSLNIQMQFYALLPFMLLALLWFRNNEWLRYNLWSIKGAGLFATLCFLSFIITLAFAARYSAIAEDSLFIKTPFYDFFNPDSDYDSLYAKNLYYNLSTRILPFLLGVALAYSLFFARLTVQSACQRFRWLPNAILLIALFLLTYSLNISIHNREDSFYQPFSPTANLWHLTTNKYLFCLGMSLLMFLVLHSQGLARYLIVFLELRIWQPLAKLIYPLYLFHFPFIIIAAAITLQTTDRNSITSLNTVEVLLTFALATTLSILFAILPHLLIEKPFIRLSKRMTNK